MKWDFEYYINIFVFLLLFLGWLLCVCYSQFVRTFFFHSRKNEDGKHIKSFSSQSVFKWMSLAKSSYNLIFELNRVFIFFFRWFSLDIYDTHNKMYKMYNVQHSVHPKALACILLTTITFQIVYISNANISL